MIGCPAKPQKMLANHFSKYHPDIVGEERKRMLSGARRVAPEVSSASDDNDFVTARVCTHKMKLCGLDTISSVIDWQMYSKLNRVERMQEVDY